ncbi:MAG: site-specific integrase [Pirellulales bacterium]|nr:site-specific integrase [Pirellulales bacterium]
MFEKLAKEAVHLERYRTGPYADERRRFLAYLTERGLGRSRLEGINRLLLSVARHICLDGDAKYSARQLASLAKDWIRNEPKHGGSQKSIRSRELDFLFVAKQWLSYLKRLDTSEPPRPFDRELSQFLSHLRTECGFAEATIENRRNSLALFFGWLSERGQTLSEVGLDEIGDYQKACGQRGWKRTTLSLHVQALRAFFRYAASQGWAHDIAPGIGAPRLYSLESIPEGPSRDDVRSLLSNESGNSPVQIRNRAMLLLFAIYGFRLSEVRHLRLEDVDWENERIMLHRTKVRKAQEYPLVREVGEAILCYLKDVRPQSSHRVLFLTLRQPHRPLSRGGLSAMVQKRMRAVNPRLTHSGPHALRHACATHLLARGLTLKEIGDHLGHVSVAATRMYAKVDILALRKVAALDMSELVAYAQRADESQTPIIACGDLAGLREVAKLHLGVVL